MNKLTIISWEQYFKTNKLYFVLSFAFFCLFLAILTIFLVVNYQQNKKPLLSSFNNNVSIIEETEAKTKVISTMIVVDIGGAIKNSGVYQLAEESRLADLVKNAGGFKEEEINKLWLQKNLNLAEKLTDGKKYYIPYLGEMIIEDLTSFNNDNNQLFQENIDNLISINQAALKTLTTLPSVGEVRGQAIIDNRPYTKIEELLTNEVVTETIFEKIKNLITL